MQLLVVCTIRVGHNLVGETFFTFYTKHKTVGKIDPCPNLTFSSLKGQKSTDWISWLNVMRISFFIHFFFFCKKTFLNSKSLEIELLTPGNFAPKTRFWRKVKFLVKTWHCLENFSRRIFLENSSKRRPSYDVLSYLSYVQTWTTFQEIILKS